MSHVHWQGAIILCLVLVLSGCDLSGQDSSVPSTPTPQHAVPATVMLGGTYAAFLAKYGEPDRGRYDEAEFTTTSRWGPLGISILTDAQRNEQDNANDRVYYLDIGIANDNPARWTLADVKAACNPLMPPDAVYERVVPAVVGLGTIKLYRSTLLANTLPASYFVDYQQQPMKPGEFEVAYSFYSPNNGPTDTAHYGGCLLAAGIADEL